MLTHYFPSDMRDESNFFYVFNRPTIVYDEDMDHSFTTSSPYYTEARLDQMI